MSRSHSNLVRSFYLWVLLLVCILSSIIWLFFAGHFPAKGAKTAIEQTDIASHFHSTPSSKAAAIIQQNQDIQSTTQILFGNRRLFSVGDDSIALADECCSGKWIVRIMDLNGALLCEEVVDLDIQDMAYCDPWLVVIAASELICFKPSQAEVEATRILLPASDTTQYQYTINIDFGLFIVRCDTAEVFAFQDANTGPYLKPIGRLFNYSNALVACNESFSIIKSTQDAILYTHSNDNNMHIIDVATGLSYPLMLSEMLRILSRYSMPLIEEDTPEPDDQQSIEYTSITINDHKTLEALFVYLGIKDIIPLPGKHEIAIDLHAKMDDYIVHYNYLSGEHKHIKKTLYGADKNRYQSPRDRERMPRDGEYVVRYNSIDNIQYMVNIQSGEERVISIPRYMTSLWPYWDYRNSSLYCVGRGDMLYVQALDALFTHTRVLRYNFVRYVNLDKGDIIIECQQDDNALSVKIMSKNMNVIKQYVFSGCIVSFCNNVSRHEFTFLMRNNDIDSLQCVMLDLYTLGHRYLDVYRTHGICLDSIDAIYAEGQMLYITEVISSNKWLVHTLIRSGAVYSYGKETVACSNIKTIYNDGSHSIVVCTDSDSDDSLRWLFSSDMSGKYYKEHLPLVYGNKTARPIICSIVDRQIYVATTEGGFYIRNLPLQSVKYVTGMFVNDGFLYISLIVKRRDNLTPYRIIKVCRSYCSVDKIWHIPTPCGSLFQISDDEHLYVFGRDISENAEIKMQLLFAR